MFVIVNNLLDLLWPYSIFFSPKLWKITFVFKLGEFFIQCNNFLFNSFVSTHKNCFWNVFFHTSDNGKQSPYIIGRYEKCGFEKCSVDIVDICIDGFIFLLVNVDGCFFSTGWLQFSTGQHQLSEFLKSRLMTTGCIFLLSMLLTSKIAALFITPIFSRIFMLT